MRADALVLFGASGDLARKKLLPALYHLAAAGRLGVPVVGAAVSDWDDTRLRAHATEAVEAAEVDATVVKELAGSLAMVSGDYREPATFAALARRLAQAGAARPVTTWPSLPGCSRWWCRAWPAPGAEVALPPERRRDDGQCQRL